VSIHIFLNKFKKLLLYIDTDVTIHRLSLNITHSSKLFRLSCRTRVAFSVHSDLRAGANYQSFLSFEATHPRTLVFCYLLRLNQARPPLASSLSLSPNTLSRDLPLVLALAASLRASSCTRRSPPQRRTIRIPISLPAFLSPCGRVRYSRSIRWITCIPDKRWMRIREQAMSSLMFLGCITPAASSNRPQDVWNSSRITAEGLRIFLFKSIVEKFIVRKLNFTDFGFSQN